MKRENALKPFLLDLISVAVTDRNAEKVFKHLFYCKRSEFVNSYYYDRLCGWGSS